MAKPATAPAPSLYCRKCSYDLRGQIEHRCPECGRPYDPAKPKTFRRKPRGKAARWIKHIAALVVVLLLVATAPYAWLYYDWHREQAAVRRIEEYQRLDEAPPPQRPGALLDVLDGDYHHEPVTYERLELPILTRLLPSRYGWMLQRVKEVSYPGLRLSDADLVLIARCRRLRALYAYHSRVSDEGIAALSGLRDLREVSLAGHGITDASATKLARCQQLEWVGLGNTSLTGSGVEAIGQLPALTGLYLTGPQIADATAARLSNCGRLTKLYLEDTSITDVGLAQLCRLSRLKTFDIGSRALTDPGLAPLTNLQNVEDLWISAPRIGDDGLAVLGRLSALPRLQFLYVRADGYTPKGRDDLYEVMRSRAYVEPFTKAADSPASQPVP